MILVTGGAGYIGGIVAERLIEQGREVCIYDNLCQGHRDVIPPQSAFVQADIGDREALRKAFREYPIRAVMHFAAHALVGESMQDPGKYFRNNLGNAITLLEETHAAGVDRFVFSSTCAVFGDRNPSPIAEDAPKSPVNPYGEAKLAFEKVLDWFHQVHGLAYFCLRYFNACGATETRGERHDPETHLIPLVLNVAAGESDAIRIFGNDYPTPDGTCIRDYIHVLDLADAHILALEADRELSGCYNLGTERGNSVREVVETVQRVTGKPIPEVVVPRRPGDPPELVANATKIRQKLGWRSRHDLEAAVRSAWEFKRKIRARTDSGGPPPRF
jgi:UDP-glucose 4-epimerase